MKKHQIVAAVGTIAIAANLLLPSLSFAQNQQGQVDVNCPAAGTVALLRVPANVTFEDASGLGSATTVPVSSPTTGTASAYDTDAGNFTTAGAFPGGNLATATDPTIAEATDRQVNDHLLGVRDQSSNGSDNCPIFTPPSTTYDNWEVTATITSLDNGGNKALVGPGTSSILASSIKIATVKQVNHDNLNPNRSGGSIALNAPQNVYYNDFTTTGNGHQVTSATAASTGANYTTLSTYGTHTLDTTVPVMTRCPTGVTEGENTDITTGIAMVIDNGIQTLQAAGTYTGTIQYTFQNIPSCHVS